MSTQLSRELPPLAVVEPQAQAVLEPLPVLEPTPANTLPALGMREDVAPVDLPPLGLIDAEPLDQPAKASEVLPVSAPAEVAAAAPTTVPKVTKRAAIKKHLYDLDTKAGEAVRPAYVASKEKGKQYAKSAAGRLAVAATTLRVTSVKLKQSAPSRSTIKLPKASSKKALAGVTGAAFAVGQTLKQTPAKLKPLDDKAFALKDRLRDRMKDSNLTERALDLPKLLAAKTMTRLSELDNTKTGEALYSKRYYLGAAIGLLSVGTTVWLRTKGMDGIFDTTPDVYEASTAVTDAPSPAATEAPASPAPAPETISNPVKPFESLAALEEVAAPAEAPAPAPTEVETVTIGQGDGFVDLIQAEFAEEGVEISAADAYDKYVDLDAQLDGQLITGETYEMANGDQGISSPGQSTWQLEATRVMEEMIEAEKKKRAES